MRPSEVKIIAHSRSTIPGCPDLITFQLRYWRGIHAEHATLKHRLMLLNNFLNDRASHALVNASELYRMQEQQQYMQGYLRVLEDRIRVFAPALV